MRETLDYTIYTIRIGSTPAFFYFDLYLYSAYAAHYVYYENGWVSWTDDWREDNYYYTKFLMKTHKTCTINYMPS